MANKQQRYLQKVKTDWLKGDYSIFKKLSEHEVSCTVCSTKTVQPVVLKVGGRGKAVLKDHLGTAKHKEAVSGDSGSATPQTDTLDTFMGVNKQVCAGLCI